MGNVVKLRRKPRPLRKEYNPLEPYQVFREDLENGSINYGVEDTRPDSFRLVCQRDDDFGTDNTTKHDMEEIARALNLLISYKIDRSVPVRKKFGPSWDGGDEDE